MTDFTVMTRRSSCRFPARDGKEHALDRLLALFHPHTVVTAAEGAGTTEDVRLSTYQSKVQDYFRALEEGMQRLNRHAVSIILAHAHIAECEFGGGEWRSSVFPVNAAFLPAHVHYVALGHMHKPQAIPGAKHKRTMPGRFCKWILANGSSKRASV